MPAETGSLQLPPNSTRLHRGRTGANARSAWMDLTFPVAVFFASRAILALLGWLSPRLLASPHISANASVLPANDTLYRGGSWTQPWFRFDTGWYVGVAEHGYHWGMASRANTNFLPFYPGLIDFGRFLLHVSPWLAAWLVSNIAFLIAVILLWEWSRRRFTDPVAQRFLILLCIFPFSFFYATPYSESVFLALAVAAFLLAESDHWTAAVVAASLSTVTRPVGLAVIVGLVAMAVSQRNGRRAFAAILGVLPLAGFSFFLMNAFGHPLAFLVSHSGGWVKPHGGILTTFASQFNTYLTPFDRIDAFLAVLFLGGGIAAWRKLGAGYGAYVLSGTLLPLVHGLVGMERYVIVLFPAFAVWAALKSKPLQIALFSISLIGLIRRHHDVHYGLHPDLGAYGCEPG